MLVMEPVEAAGEDLRVGETEQVPRDPQTMGMAHVVGVLNGDQAGFAMTGDVIEGQELADVARVPVRPDAGMRPPITQDVVRPTRRAVIDQVDHGLGPLLFEQARHRLAQEMDRTVEREDHVGLDRLVRIADRVMAE